jgi:hypothetical protein
MTRQPMLECDMETGLCRILNEAERIAIYVPGHNLPLSPMSPTEAKNTNEPTDTLTDAHMNLTEFARKRNWYQFTERCCES